jgi:hemin uptake protein HemP
MNGGGAGGRPGDPGDDPGPDAEPHDSSYAIPVVDFNEVAGQRPFIFVRFDGTLYQLRRTKNGRLLLQK